MTVLVLPTESQIFTSLRSFILANTNIVSADNIKKGQANRVAIPSAADFVIMTPLRRERLETNIDTYADAVFTGSIAGNQMTIESVFFGPPLQLGTAIFGIDILDGTFVQSFGTGSGSVGTYTLNNSQTFASGVIAAGTQSQLQPVEWTIQIDFYGPNGSDNCHRVSTLFRDEYASTAFASGGISYPTGVSVMPLYADDPRQVPFIDDSNQYNDRWILEACLQANQAVINIPQQFFDKVVVGLIDVDTHYPA